MPLRHSHATSGYDETMHAHYQSSKAKFRPGKRPPPTLLARAASLVSLPSPPADAHDGSSDVEMEHTEDEDEDEIDQLASDNDDDEATNRRAPNPCLLGSPANFLGAPAGTAISASRKQLLNPFLPPTVGGGGGESSSLRPFPGAPLSPSSSPVRPERQNPSPSRRRHRSDPDRIRLSAAAAAAAEGAFPGLHAAGVTTTPPSKARQLATTEADAEKRDEQEEQRRAMGWYDEDNPFVDRNDDMARRLQHKEPLTRPETVTWVK